MPQKIRVEEKCWILQIDMQPHYLEQVNIFAAVCGLTVAHTVDEQLFVLVASRLFLCCSLHFPSTPCSGWDWYVHKPHRLDTPRQVSASPWLFSLCGRQYVRTATVQCSMGLRVYRCVPADWYRFILWTPGKSRALLYSDTGEKAHL